MTYTNYRTFHYNTDNKKWERTDRGTEPKDKLALFAEMLKAVANDNNLVFEHMADYSNDKAEDEVAYVLYFHFADTLDQYCFEILK